MRTHAIASQGFSKWKVCLRAGGGLIGRAGFPNFEKTGEVEFGFIFNRASWGNGYATECAWELLMRIFANRSDVGHVIAFAQLGNEASRCVLGKIGTKCIGVCAVKGIGHEFYCLKR